MTRLAKIVALSAGAAAALVAGPVLAMQATDSVMTTTLTPEQLDALKSVLSSLPRQ